MNHGEKFLSLRQINVKDVCDDAILPYQSFSIVPSLSRPFDIL